MIDRCEVTNQRGRQRCHSIGVSRAYRLKKALSSVFIDPPLTVNKQLFGSSTQITTRIYNMWEHFGERLQKIVNGLLVEYFVYAQVEAWK